MALPAWLLAALSIAAALVIVQFAPWITLAIWLALYGRRIQMPLARALHGRARLAAALTTSLLLVVVLPMAAVLTVLAIDAVQLARQLLESGQVQAVLVKLVEGNGIDVGGEGRPGSGIIDLLISQGDRAYELAQRLAGAALRLAVGLFVLVTGIYGVLVDGHLWYQWFEQHTPIGADNLRRLSAAFVETGRGLWFGIVGAGLLQSIIATITYFALGVPSAVPLGMLTLMFSVIPAVGTAVVWVPVAAGLALTGRPVAAIAMAVIGAGVIGSVDNVARPYLTRRGKLQLPMWLVLLSMFGGVELIGGWGLLMGPLVVRLAKEALAIATDQRAAAVAPPAPPSPPPPSPPPAQSPATSDQAVATTDAS